MVGKRRRDDAHTVLAAGGIAAYLQPASDLNRLVHRAGTTLSEVVAVAQEHGQPGAGEEQEGGAEAPPSTRTFFGNCRARGPG